MNESTIEYHLLACYFKHFHLLPAFLIIVIIVRLS